MVDKCRYCLSNPFNDTDPDGLVITESQRRKAVYEFLLPGRYSNEKITCLYIRHQDYSAVCGVLQLGLLTEIENRGNTMNKSHLLGAVCAFLFALMAMSANAALVGRLPATLGGSDYQAYYDDVADLTWLADANSSGIRMIWSEANAWAAGLNIGGVTGWRLPDTVQPDATCSVQSGGSSWGYNCTGIEMGNLHYNVLGGILQDPISATHNDNYFLFSNIQSAIYWSSTELASDPTIAWYFDFDDGGVQADFIGGAHFAWAVHDGDVVPVPAAAWLFGSALGLLGWMKRRTG